MLSTPPAFILSQDQTLMFNLFASRWTIAFVFRPWFLMVTVFRFVCLDAFSFTLKEFSRLHYCLIIKVLIRCCPLFSNGEGGIWTLAPLLTTCTLSRGVPSASLVLLQITELVYHLFIYDNGEGGIRTHAPLRTNGFQDRLVMTTSIPLRVSCSSAQDI